jgi:predicted dehydrogenase
MSRDVTRWGVAGTGGIAHMTLPDLGLTENVEVAAVSSRTQDGADTFAAEHGIAQAYGDYSSLLANPDLDVIYICTPHGAHFAMAEAAIKAGKSVLCEKPLTITARQAEELSGLARSRGVFLMEAMWTKFNPTIGRIKETIASGVIGDVRHVNAAFGFSAPRDPASRFWDPAQGGGALLDLGVYPITLAHLFLGKPDVVSALGSIGADGVDTRVVLTLASGEVLAQAAASIVHALPANATISGTTGFIDVAAPFWCPPSFTVFPQGMAPWAPPPEVVTVEQEGNGYVPMFRATSAAVLQGLTESPAHPLSATVEVLEVIDRVRRQLLDVHHPGSGPISPWHDEVGG